MKLKSPYFFFSSLIAPICVMVGFCFGGFAYFTLPIVGLILPILDHIIGVDFAYPAAPAKKGDHDQSMYRLPTRLYVVLQVIVIIWGAYLIGMQSALNWETLGIIATVGMASSQGFTVAHELIHKVRDIDNKLGRLMLIFTGTGHGVVEHLAVHHNAKITATDNDHVHSYLNQSFYDFCLRAIINQRTKGFQFERDRLAKKGLGPWSLQNQVLFLNLMSLSIAIIFMVLFGWKAAAYFVIQCLIGNIIVLEIAYVQHYGIERKKNADGTWEPYTLAHSWDSNYQLSNYFFFNLPRHAYHHRFPNHDYEQSQSIAEDPQLRFSYLTSLTLVLIPPLWFKVMNTRALEARKRIEHYLKEGQHIDGW